MNVRTEIVALGLVGLIYSGCDGNRNITSDTTSKVGGTVVLTKPEGCVEVRDIRWELGNGHGHRYYQLLCVDADQKLSLYQRSPSAEEWSKISVE